MTKILIINKCDKGAYREKTAGNLLKEKTSRENFCSGRKGSVKIGLAGAGSLMIFFVIFSCACYLFQVNDLAVKGYVIRDLEKKISQLEKENKQMQIREMELRSMYVIEKSAENFNLVSPVNVTYLEVGNTVALR